MNKIIGELNKIKKEVDMEYNEIKYKAEIEASYIENMRKEKVRRDQYIHNAVHWSFYVDDVENRLEKNEIILKAKEKIEVDISFKEYIYSLFDVIIREQNNSEDRADVLYKAFYDYKNYVRTKKLNRVFNEKI